MSSSELSDLSSPLSTEEDVDSTPPKSNTLDHYFKNALPTKSAPPPKKKRPLSPPHEYVLADNPDVAFVCMFRSRFNDAFPKSLPNYGPQDIEHGVIETVPSEQVERLLCALLGLVLNRKKDIEYVPGGITSHTRLLRSAQAAKSLKLTAHRRGHYQRALEEAVQSHTSQWPLKWEGNNPLHRGGNFNNMSPEERLTLLSTLVLWSLGSSEAIQDIIKTMYKRQRQNDDRNQPLSVQPWGTDVDKRRYWLIEGLDDTPFRLYRESNPALKHVAWRSVAGSIEELNLVAGKLEEDGSQASRRLRDSIQAAIPRFEAGEDKRKRREYRMARKAQFTRPDPGFSLYEGRTRGKRIKYTFSDEEDGVSDAQSTRRSNRQSGLSTPAEPARPTITASGRHVKSRHGGAYGEIIANAQHDQGQAPSFGGLDGTGDDDETPALDLRAGRVTRNRGGRQGWQAEDSDSIGGMNDESDATSSGHEWDGGDGGDDDEADELADDGKVEVDMNSDVSEDELVNDKDPHLQPSLVVSLRYPKPASSTPSSIPRAPEEMRAIQIPNGLSDQAPPPEANPFATPTNTDFPTPQLANGLAHSTSGASIAVGQHHVSPDSPAIPLDKVQPTI
ncbi:MAG: hypothetical protein Q9196_003169 [Gyalolechia fulgens]